MLVEKAYQQPAACIWHLCAYSRLRNGCGKEHLGLFSSCCPVGSRTRAEH